MKKKEYTSLVIEFISYAINRTLTQEEISKLIVEAEVGFCQNTPTKYVIQNLNVVFPPNPQKGTSAEMFLRMLNTLRHGPEIEEDPNKMSIGVFKTSELKYPHKVGSRF